MRESAGLQNIASRVHPLFGIVFTIVIYMAIGPFFGIPRTATVSYEIGIVPFLPYCDRGYELATCIIHNLIFHDNDSSSIKPSKASRPYRKSTDASITICYRDAGNKKLHDAMGEIGQPQGKYITQPFFHSFVEGYLTMDVIAALVFGIVVINALKVEGVTEKGPVMKAMIIAGLVAATGLTLVYVSLSYIGATSVDAVGIQDNGGAILTLASTVLIRNRWNCNPCITIIFACLTTAIGLVSACAQYFEEILRRYPIKPTYHFRGI